MLQKILSKIKELQIKVYSGLSVEQTDNELSNIISSLKTEIYTNPPKIEKDVYIIELTELFKVYPEIVYFDKEEYENSYSREIRFVYKKNDARKFYDKDAVEIICRYIENQFNYKTKMIKV